MAYIGNIPAESYASFETETFSVSATANYTLSHAVTNENEIRLVINGVVQQPGSGKAYTASGTTLTLTSATVSGDVMYAVYLGRALQTINPPNASVGSAQIADDLISGKTALGATPADTDELLISDAGTLKRVDYSYLKVDNTPAFSVTNSADQSIPNDTNTKITFDTEIFDSDSAFASNKFVIPVAGKYLINAMVRIESSTDAPIEIKFYKNGSSYKKRRIGQQLDYDTISFTDIDTYAVNDYLEVYYLQGTGGSVNISGGTSDEFRAIFQGYKLIGV